MANEQTVRTVANGGRLNPRFVIADIAFDASGDASVTAASLGLQTILGFAGGPWGGTTNAVASVYSDTAFSSNGKATVSLECRESDEGTDADLNKTFSILFWGVAGD